MELAELIAALERADGLDRELDGAIWEAMGLVDEAHCRWWCRMDGRTDLTRGHYIAVWAPAYTASIDAALTLVPEGWFVSTIAQWRSTTPTRTWAATLKLDPECDEMSHASNKPTPALALCIAALRARSSQS